MSDISDRISKLSPEKRALLERRMQAQNGPARGGGEPIAVIGIGCRFPGDANSPQEFWEMLVKGSDAIREIPPERWCADDFYDPDSTVPGKMTTRWGGFLDGIENFDPDFFDITFREALHMDPQQRLFIETVWEALEDAGLVVGDLAGSSTGVFVSAHNLSSDYYVRQWAEYGDIDAYSATGGAHSIIANRVSYWFDLQGPSLVVDTACSASLVATHLAINSIASGESDLAIAGGVNLIPSPDTSIALSGLQMMAADGRCKTFDSRADGFVRGEGCGAVVLKRLSDAQRDGDEIYALIRGSAINQDGRTNGLTAPNGLSQQKVLHQALKRAGVDSANVGYIESHGTGTALGDPIEVEALTEVMGRPADGMRCAIGAVKTNIGHLESASGIAGLIKAVLVLHNEYIPPNLHFTGLNPHISLDDTRFVLPTDGLAWPADGAPRFAGVSSFGFGGTNAHIVLEEAPKQSGEPSVDIVAPEDSVLVLSAKDERALTAVARNYLDVLSAGEVAYPDVCYSAACRRTHHEHRLTVLAADAGESADALREFLDGESPPTVLTRIDQGNGAPRTAWVFSGQGSQRVGMGQALFDTEPVFRETIERIDHIFSTLADWSLTDMIRTADEEQLARTEIAQPAIFAIEVGLAEVLRHCGMRPDMVVGHSLGEVAAAHVGGALTLEDAVTIIFHRGRLMQSLHGAGRMAAVSGKEEDVHKILAAAHRGVSIAAVNGPYSITVSGEPGAVDALLDDVEWPCQVLPVEYAFHSKQMEPLRAEFETAISSIQPGNPGIAVYSTVRGSLAQRGDFGPEYWARNIREPVMFASAIDNMARGGASCFVELGPQSVLGPAIEQCLEAGGYQASVHGALLRNKPERVREIISALFVHGLPVDWSRYFRDRGRTVRLPTYPWQRRRCWFDPRVEMAADSDQRANIDTWGYEVAWPLRTPLEGWIERAPVAKPPALDKIAANVVSRRDAIYSKHAADDSIELVKLLEDRAVGYAVAALRKLGFPLQPGDRYSREDLAGAARDYRQRIVTRLFGLLAERSAISYDGDTWSVNDKPLESNEIPKLPFNSAAGSEFLALLDRCGEQVAAVVNGKCDPLSLLFPGDYSSSAEWVYADAPISRVANDMVAEVVMELVNSLPDSQTLRVLEIGAGTGGSTRTILPKLRPDRTEYLFTDLSQSFLKQAQERFATDLPMTYALLDIEVDPVEQGIAQAQFDLVIAANVIHATADLKQSLQNARDMLAPGGVLVLLEGTARRGWIDLTFGLTEGWWRFTDTDIRHDHPLLGATGWQDLLRDCGFEDVTAIQAERDSAGCLFEQAILLARAPTIETPDNVATEVLAPESTAPWIVIGEGDADGVSAALARELQSEAIPCVLVAYTDGAASFADGQYCINPARRDDCVELLQKIEEAFDTEPQAVVHLGAIDEQAEAGAAAEWDACMTRTCGGVLHLMQALEENGVQPEYGVWVTTRGVQPVIVDGRATSVAQAPLWGLGRVAAREKPELWGGLIDLDFVADAGRDAAALRRIISQDRSESQIALRSGDRFVARLIAKQSSAAETPGIRSDRSYLIVGGLGGIGLQVARWLVDNGARHLTLTGRRGLPSPGESPAAELIRELEDAGATITVEAADSTDPVRMENLFGAFDSDRPTLAGVLHTAAVIEFQSLEDMQLEDFLAATRAKVAGSWVLHEQTAALSLDFFVLFSSMAAIGGFPQLGHYSAGNSFMDALAHRRRELGFPAVSINWGLWSDGRSTSDDNKQLFERIGLRAMPTAKALQGLQRALASNSAQTTFAWVDWDTFRPVYESRGDNSFLSQLALQFDSPTPGATRIESERQSALRKQLDAADPEAALKLLEDSVRDSVATILGVHADEVTAMSEGFFQMGMDSIMTVELRRRLESSLQINLPTTLAFEYPTIERLTEYLASELLDLERATVETVDTDDNLDSFSDAELAAELDRELSELGSAGRSTTN